MITREDIRELARFESAEGKGCALSFYFQPTTPQNKSHREEGILAKDLVRAALQEAEKNGRNGETRADLNRILEIAASLHGNQARAMAIFACGAQNFWRSFDLPPRLPGSQLMVNRRFHLKPLAVLLGAQPRLCVAIVDRQRARLFDLRLDELKEREGIFRNLPRWGRSDGYAGYDAGHSERRVADEVLHHFKEVAGRLKEELDRGGFEKLIIGCLDKTWSEFEPQLHPYVKQRLLGHFPAEVTTVGNEEIREQANRILQEALNRRRCALVKEVLGQAQRNGLGVTGLRRVLRSLELGEVQSLLIGEAFRAHAVECTACGHLDAHLLRACAVCTRPTREIDDVGDAIIATAIQRDIELFYVKDDPAFDHVGNIAALLRFRSDQNTPSKTAVA
jgi:peptide subunit release factor 1 (eRF1)